ncbi:histidinol dehydrogenase [Sphingomonas sp. BN140010]|uniref:Histidinol dehydrogenase n=1 Tax=Sphingomonas arvum TaxID=2992113 RepID=A0ABT3JBM8_9SPHN|nr:histidinol dehydrogenase [Sphingomonas sp. BN140010]MCW3796426.1 histidinol dehydrogenase [Sphingomonas sp. BN140010]
MKSVVWNELGAVEQAAVLSRPSGRADPALKQTVATIVEDVRADGWEAVVRHAEQIDRAAPELVPVADGAREARRMLSSEQRAAIELAVANIRTFHQASRPADVAVEIQPGLMVRKLWRPIDRVGLYVPGGATPLFSTLLMLALPAEAAGVGELVVVTPPCDASLDPLVALSAELCGIDAVWTIGGAQAIAALAFGAGAIPRCDKICGPGNAWVAEAKTLVASLPGGPAIDMPAGPSELLVIADGEADPAVVAADLLSQAEHDSQAQVMLATDSASLLEAVRGEVQRQVADLPRRATAEASLEQARLVLCPDLDTAAEVANAYAPEHLSLNLADPEALLPSICNAGAVFAGRQSAETFGDYCAGSSHVLPTDGAARAWSGVSVLTFMKAMTVQQLADGAAQAIAPVAAALARLEGLEAHARAADARVNA